MDLNSVSYTATSSRSTPSARKLVKHSGSLEVIQVDKNTVAACQSSSTGYFNSDSSRPWSRCSVGSIPPRTDSVSSKSVTTPTRQVTLQAVKRKDEGDWDYKISKYDLQLRNTLEKLEWNVDCQQRKEELTRKDPKSQHGTKQHYPQNQPTVKTNKEEDLTFDFISSIEVRPIVEPRTGCRKDDSEEDSSTENEEAPPVEKKAPNELLMEFVDCLMKKEYKTAEKLCQMILLFEPKNPEALKFQPLLQRKIKLDERALLDEEDGEDDSDDSSSDDSEDDSDCDDSEDSTSSGESLDLVEQENNETEKASSSEQDRNAQNPARAILQLIFGGKAPEFIGPDTHIDLAEEIKKLDEF